MSGEDYRKMMWLVFPPLSKYLPDKHSIEIRDHLSKPKESLLKTQFAYIPSAEILECAFHKSGHFDINLRTNYKDRETGNG